MLIKSKFDILFSEIRKYKKIAIAFSGGLDSSFLSYFAIKILGVNNVFLFTGISETYPKADLEKVRLFSKKYNIKIHYINTKEFNNRNFIKNPKDRCFFCKSELFSDIKAFQKKTGFDVIFDGSNYSDLSDYRPGAKAKSIYNIESPLQKAKLTKDDIHLLAKKEKLYFYNYVSSPCLASRIFYGTEINKEILTRIEKAECFIKEILNKNNIDLRVRDDGNNAIIELPASYNKKIITFQDKIHKYLHSLNYKSVLLDLSGYKQGKLNFKK